MRLGERRARRGGAVNVASEVCDDGQLPPAMEDGAAVRNIDAGELTVGGDRSQ
jgi:hypothetical protein